jgi:hypothetical protein
MVEPGTKPRSLAHAPTFERAAPQAAHERARGLRACTHKSRLFGNRWLPQMTCADCAGSSGDLLPPSPPAEEATTRQDQARNTRTDNGAGDKGHLHVDRVIGGPRPNKWKPGANRRDGVLFSQRADT